MKGFILLFIFTLVAFEVQATEITVDNSVNQRLISSQVVKYIESLKPKMAYGWPEKHIPPLAPFVIEHANVSAGLFFLGAYARIDDFTVNGLDGFDILDFRLSTIRSRCNFDFLFSQINLTTLHEYGVRLGLRFGHRSSSFFGLENVSVKGQGLYSLNLITQKIRFRELWLYMNIGKVVSRIDLRSRFWLPNRLFNNFLARIVEMVFNSNTELWAELINEYGVPIMNEYLENNSIFDLRNIKVNVNG